MGRIRPQTRNDVFPHVHRSNWATAVIRLLTPRGNLRLEKLLDLRAKWHPKVASYRIAALPGHFKILRSVSNVHWNAQHQSPLFLIAPDCGSQNALRRTAKSGPEFKYAACWNGNKSETPRDKEISKASARPARSLPNGLSKSGSSLRVGALDPIVQRSVQLCTWRKP